MSSFYEEHGYEMDEDDIQDIMMDAIDHFDDDDVPSGWFGDPDDEGDTELFRAMTGHDPTDDDQDAAILESLQGEPCPYTGKNQESLMSKKHKAFEVCDAEDVRQYISGCIHQMQIDPRPARLSILERIRMTLELLNAEIECLREYDELNPGPQTEPDPMQNSLADISDEEIPF